MNVRSIVEDFLKANGYGGLCNYNCGCEVGDLMPCDMDFQHNCEPGYVHYCKDCTQAKECDSDARQLDNDVAHCVSKDKEMKSEA